MKISRKQQKVHDAIKAITRVNDRLIADVYSTHRANGPVPLPGTIPHSVYLCWRMAEELGLVDDESETD